MPDTIRTSTQSDIGICLVDGESSVRHARQLMLRSEGYAVRSYPTCAALLADPASRRCRCLVLDVETDGGATLLRSMRATGWRGTALLLGGTAHDEAATGRGDVVAQRTAGNQSLLTAIAMAVDHGRARWDATG